MSSNRHRVILIVIGVLGTGVRRLVFWIWGPERLTLDRLGGKWRFGNGSKSHGRLGTSANTVLGKYSIVN